jgi:hypothetical protein
MVLMPFISQFIQAAASGTSPRAAPAGGAGLNHTINVSTTINGNADKDTLASHSQHIVTVVRRELRRINLV